MARADDSSSSSSDEENEEDENEDEKNVPEGDTEDTQEKESSDMLARLAGVPPADEQQQQQHQKFFNLCLYKCSRRISGAKFTILVMLRSSTARALETDPQSLFDSEQGAPDDPRQAISPFDFVFKFYPSPTSETPIASFQRSAQELLDWLPEGYDFDMSSHFRRQKFAMYLQSMVYVRYTALGVAVFDLFPRPY